ncbi:YfbM family protein [Pseudoduganella violaceinigra]|uniref:YfbM family protein n=1 Tax=Pseudoduganella violaceinigra TaxID=246602 RepID=UPI0004899F24|nr:YfbM family protein [Pseudoduganella violaceinigra]
MGMIGCFASLPEETLVRLQGDEDSVEDFLYPDDGESDPENFVDIDKAWHGIHYLLTGTADGGSPPLSLAIIGGDEFGPDMGYGPARFLTAAQVASITDALEGLSAESLSARFDPQDMGRQQIYPDSIWVRDGAVGLEYLLEYFEVLRTFYRDAASRGDAVIQWLS